MVFVHSKVPHCLYRPCSAWAVLLLIGLLAQLMVVRSSACPQYTALDSSQYGAPVVVVMPTYTRLNQGAALAYVSSILKASKDHLFWLLIDDGRASKDKHISDLLTSLNNSGVPYWFIKPSRDKDCPDLNFGTCYNPSGHRGAAQRNLALRFIREKLYLSCDAAWVESVLSSNTSTYGPADSRLGEVGTVLGMGACPAKAVPGLFREEPIIYFADDDNLYEFDIIREVSKTKRISIFPVGFPQTEKSGFLSTPVVDANGSITGITSHACGRIYPVDMANFAFSAKLIHTARRTRLAELYAANKWQRHGHEVQGSNNTIHKTSSVAQNIGDQPVRFYLHTPKGHLESDLLEQLIGGLREMEILGDGATRVMVWHMPKEDKQKQHQAHNGTTSYVTCFVQPTDKLCQVRL